MWLSGLALLGVGASDGTIEMLSGQCRISGSLDRILRTGRSMLITIKAIKMLTCRMVALEPTMPPRSCAMPLAVLFNIEDDDDAHSQNALKIRNRESHP